MAYTAHDALKDLKFLSPEYGSSGEQHKAYERILDFLHNEKFREQIPEVCREFDYRQYWEDVRNQKEK